MKNKKAGFTLVEILIAVAILVMMATVSITTVTMINQARVKKAATAVVSYFNLTKDFAKTHGGNATFELERTKEGLTISRKSYKMDKGERKEIVDETESINDRTIKVFYKMTGDSKEYELNTIEVAGGTEDPANGVIQMTFYQTTGEIIGPHKLDYIIISNSSKTYKLLIKQATGQIYYDYEVDEDKLNVSNDEIKRVPLPTFIFEGVNTADEITLHLKESSGSKTGFETIQPDLNYDSHNVKIGGVYRAAAPGEYTITFTLKDPYSTTWDDDGYTTTEKTLTWKADMN